MRKPSKTLLKRLENPERLAKSNFSPLSYEGVKD
jgi:hypothetical protein